VTLQCSSAFVSQRTCLYKPGVVRVSNEEAREKFGLVGSATMDMSGLCFPYNDPLTGSRHTCRVRRDNPEWEKGKEKGKYQAPFGDKRHLYLVPGCGDLIDDVNVPLVLSEAEKSTLALTAWSDRIGRKILPVGLGGAWGWRARVGKRNGPNGERIDEKGPLPELALLARDDRKVYILLDANANSNSDVRAARTALSRELLSYGSRVLIATIPMMDGVNGPDDLIATIGDTGITSVLELATPALDVALADADEIIDKIKRTYPNLQPDDLRRALDVIADVTDELQRQVLQSRLADVVRGVMPKKMVFDEVDDRRKDREQKQENFAAKNRRMELQRLPLDLPQLIHDLEQFFQERAFLPDGAALVCAYFALNSRVYDVFDAVPYICLESATPQCGKSTVEKLLAAVSCKGIVITSMNEAIFRLIDQEHPTLCIDEAEALEARTDRAEALRAILNEGYKRGGRVPRCVGEEHEVQFFEVYSPKVFAAIGGLSGALLDRCLVIHMERAPRGSKRKSVRIRAIARDSKLLVEGLEAYAVQYRDQVQKLYDAEPNEGYWPHVNDREAELWGPLLIHARLIGATAEEQLLKVVEQFTQVKAQIEAQDPHTAKAIALLDALNELSGDTFSPADLVNKLSGTESWATTFAKAKGGDEATRERTKAAAVGFALRRFRLRPRKKSSSGSSIYCLTEALSVIGSHVPQILPYLPDVPQPDFPQFQVTDNAKKTEGTERTDGSTEASTKSISKPDQDSFPSLLQDSAATDEKNYKTPVAMPDAADFANKNTGNRNGQHSEQCYTHGVHSEFWERPSGGWVCAKCHPPARQMNGG
jgi:hypothetical protein